MATTTYGNTNTTNRTNPAIYWGIGAAIVLALIAFFALRTPDRTANTAVPATNLDSGATTPTTNMDSKMDSNTAAPAGQNTGTMNGAVGSDTSPAAGTNTEGNSGIPMGTESKSGGSMNTETLQNSNNSNTGGQPATQPASRTGH